MTPHSRNVMVRGELDQLLRSGEIDGDTHGKLSELYPVNSWDWLSLGRWFLAFGALSFAAAVVIFMRDIFDFTLPKLAVSLAGTMVLLFLLGQRLKTRSWIMAGQTLELLSAFALIGLSFVLGMIYSTGSGDWPTLLLIDLIILLPAAYLLRNKQLLLLSSMLFFVWFGGRTGYISGWGAYWFGMNYPLRFVAAAGAIVAIGALHMVAEATVMTRYRGFAKIWISVGVFLGEMALWLLSIFGNFELIDGPWRIAGVSELFLFNSLWALANIVLIFAGAKLAFRMLTGYGATFLIIQLYTLFFAHLSEGFGIVGITFIAGLSALMLAFLFESKRRKRSGAVLPE